MADLFQVLVRRAMKPPGITPRVRSRFENDAAAALNVRDVEAEPPEAAPLAPAAVATVAAHRELADPMYQVPVPPVDVPSAAERGLVPPASIAAQAPPHAGVPALKSERVRAVETATVRPLDAAPSRTPSRAVRAVAPIDSITSRPDPATAAEPVPVLSMASPAPAMPAAQPPLEPPPRAERVVKRIEQRTVRLVEPAAPAARARSAPTVPLTTPLPDPAPLAVAAAPRIEIHIGRIDVHAAPPPTPVAAAREPLPSAPKPASLDDVLARRVVKR